jgi:HAD superfamily hydrolase (TIGR01509 family)
MNNNIKVILLDLGGVLINLNYQLTIEAFERLGLKDAPAFYSQANQTKLFDQYECGQISTQRFINELLNFLPARTSPNKVVEAWNEMILDFPNERLKKLIEIGDKYPVYLLSNTNELHMQAVRRSLSKTTENSLESYFQKTFLSHEIGYRKPNADVFHFVATQMKVEFNEILFIDDSKQHIDGALKLGIDAHLLLKNENFYDLIS